MPLVTENEETVMNMKIGFGRSLAVAIIGAATLGLMACSNSSDQPPPTPKVSEATPPVAPPAATPDAAPAAADVTKEQAPVDQTSTDAKSADPSRPMTEKEESTKMPLPGQANDHSNPTTEPAKP